MSNVINSIIERIFFVLFIIVAILGIAALIQLLMRV